MKTLTELTEDQIKEQLPKNNRQCITSEMNVPSAIHIGDIWEHQIRSVRCLFFSNIGKKISPLEPAHSRDIALEMSISP